MPSFAVLNRFVTLSRTVASAATTATNAISAGVPQVDSSSNPFQILSGWNASLSARKDITAAPNSRATLHTADTWMEEFTPKTIIIKYDQPENDTSISGDCWLFHEDYLTWTVANSAYTLAAGTDGFLMQPGDELVLDFANPLKIYATSANASGQARLSFMILG